ncbi:hypothetical protein LJB81_04545 [Desulfovibrio sp. OttesenSCG-928-M14]|nr:hypothetical protein [Desulfovibrio sp. OttesenSCG-928-M14]
MIKKIIITILLIFPSNAYAGDYYFYVKPNPYYITPPSQFQLRQFDLPPSSYMIQQNLMMQSQQRQIYQRQRQQIMTWQKFLTEQGYDPGPIDGVWGPRSAQAYQEYMSKQNSQTEDTTENAWE